MDMTPQFYIVQDSHAAEEFYLLKGSRNAQFSSLIRWQLADFLPFKKNPPSLRAVKSIDTI
jgi:hypothetical protein